MKTISRMLVAAILFLTVTPGSIKADTTFVEIGKATAGHLVYFGTDVEAKEIAIDIGRATDGSATNWSLWFRPIGDSALIRSGIERLPFNPPPPVSPPASAIHEQRHSLLQSVAIAAQAARRQHDESGSLSPFEMKSALTALTTSALVDSVRPESETVFYIKWVGQDDWERVSQAAPNLQAPDHETQLRDQAERILTALRADQLVIFDRGFISCSGTKAQRRIYERDLLVIRNGGQAVNLFIPDRVADNLRQPMSLRSVVTGGAEQ